VRPNLPTDPPVAVDDIETAKAAPMTLGVVAAFALSDWLRELVVLTGASVLLVNRQIAPSDLLQHVDGHLLLVLMGLYIVHAALAATHLPQHWIADQRAAGLERQKPLWPCSWSRS